MAGLGWADLPLHVTAIAARRHCSRRSLSLAGLPAEACAPVPRPLLPLSASALPASLARPAWLRGRRRGSGISIPPRLPSVLSPYYIPSPTLITSSNHRNQWVSFAHRHTYDGTNICREGRAWRSVRLAAKGRRVETYKVCRLRQVAQRGTACKVMQKRPTYVVFLCHKLGVGRAMECPEQVGEWNVVGEERVLFPCSRQRIEGRRTRQSQPYAAVSPRQKRKVQRRGSAGSRVSKTCLGSTVVMG